MKQMLDTKSTSYKQQEQALNRAKILMTKEELAQYKHLRMFGSQKVMDLDWFYEFLADAIEQANEEDPQAVQ